MDSLLNLAPIVLFTYCRLEHTKKTINALKKNELAEHSDLIIYSDWAKSDDKYLQVLKVREYLRTIDGFKSVTVTERAVNFGLSKSIINGVTEVLKTHEKIIVLEDDLVTSRYFLRYMNEALDLYEKNDAVISIHGYMYPLNAILPETFFIPGADCWGWGTWKRGWSIFNPDGNYLLGQLKKRKLIKSFNFNNAFPYSEMLYNQIIGLNDSWAIRWYASSFLAGKFTLYPGRSLVNNIGADSTGVHCPSHNRLVTELSMSPITVLNNNVKSDPAIIEMLENFYRLESLSSVRDLPIVKKLVKYIFKIPGLRLIKSIINYLLPAPIIIRIKRLIFGGHF